MMFASAFSALPMFAQSWKDHAKPEPLGIMMSDSCNRPVSPSSSLILERERLMTHMQVHCDPQDARVLEIRSYLDRTDHHAADALSPLTASLPSLLALVGARLAFHFWRTCQQHCGA